LALKRLHRLEQGDEATFAHRLEGEAITVTVHDRFVARQFEFHRKANRLSAAWAK